MATAEHDFGPWEVVPGDSRRGECHLRPFTRSDGYRPRFYVMHDRTTGGFEISVEGPTPGAHALVRHVPELDAARDVADACGRGFGWTLAPSSTATSENGARR